jgi:hypothetical protein
MGWTLKTPVRSFWVGVAVVSLLGFLGSGESNAQTLYNITFSQFSPGSVYTNASGPPNDFSSYAISGSNAVGVSSYIVRAFTINLTNQPLVCNNAGLGVGNFLMQMGNVSSNVVTLDMQLQLDSVVGATVAFGQSGPPGSNVTSIILSFPETSTNTMQVQSVDGLSASPTVLYSFATSLVRTNLQNISFNLNLSASTFSLTVNGVSLASNAPIGSSQPLTQAAIGIGDTDGIGVGGNGGIDNIMLAAVPIPNISDIFFSGTNVLVGLTTSTNAHYDVQTTTDLVSGMWSTIYSNVPGVGGLTNFNCGSSASPQQFYRVAAHP